MYVFSPLIRKHLIFFSHFFNMPHVVLLESILRDYMWPIKRLHMATFRKRGEKLDVFKIRGTKDKVFSHRLKTLTYLVNIYDISAYSCKHLCIN